MIRKKLRLSLLLLGAIFILLLTGCFDKYDIKITTTSKEYTPFQSHQPGLPLGISVINKNGDRVSEKFNYNLKTQYGSFVTWKLTDHRVGSYKVTGHGNEYDVDNAYQVRLFWSTLNDDNSHIPEGINEIIIDIIVTDDNGELIATKKGIIKRKEGYRYSLLKE